MFVCYEALRHLKVKAVDVETPLTTTRCQMLDEQIVVVPILRAGVGMLDGILLARAVSQGRIRRAGAGRGDGKKHRRTTRSCPSRCGMG